MLLVSFTYYHCYPLFEIKIFLIALLPCVMFVYVFFWHCYSSIVQCTTLINGFVMLFLLFDVRILVCVVHSNYSH